jgi:hypothetical protein
MASTYSNIKIQLMATGENTGTWGNVTNDNLGAAIEQALVETATVTFASANQTLTLTDTNARQDARALRLNLAGTTGGARDLIVPAIQKPYIVNNGTADTITVKVSGQTGIAVPAARSMLLYNNGTDVVNALTHTPVSSGGTGTNTLTAEAVLIGNTTSNVKFVSPGTSGNVLTSNGSAWSSAAAAAFDAGTVMLFAQTAAPTGWTKDSTNFNNSGLRVVTGSASTGGSVDFTTAFASQTPTGSVAITAVSGSAGSTTLTTPQIPSHKHSLVASSGQYGDISFPSANMFAIGADNSVDGGLYMRQSSPSGTTNVDAMVNNTGGGGSHNHPFSFSSGSGTFSGNAINLAVKYVDVIRATKN